MEDKDNIAYCGLYCGNCAFKAKVIPAASLLFGEMKSAGFEGIMGFMPDGNEFWRFLKGTAESGDASCKNGCSDPGCRIRICAAERGAEFCALCAEYPCGLFDEFLAKHATLKDDNDLLKKNGADEFVRMQKERRSKGFVYGK
ncbi:MAG: DUF3795 domain-containing protein [Methanomassiliicoccaceae archaeon]|nr:DUF3795 domain-containing protein [Methanomassiliicoccaceae archaeon]